MDDGCRQLIVRLDAAVRASSVAEITAGVQRELQAWIRGGAAQLPAELIRPRPECYARRLLHRGAGTGYTAVVMTWGPGQGTALHDHAGMWCVECVVAGELTVEQFDLLEERDGRCRFARRRAVVAGVGDAGSLIPPFEYHVLSNARRDADSVTLHVYAGEMDRCNVFLPVDDGWWERQSRRLDYDG